MSLLLLPESRRDRGGIDRLLPVCEGLEPETAVLLELTRVRQEVCGEGLEGLGWVGGGVPALHVSVSGESVCPAMSSGLNGTIFCTISC